MSYSLASSSVSDGALAQLGAIGAEEKFTSCNAQETLFVQGYKRHTPFAFAQLDFAIDQTGNLPTSFANSASTSITAKLPRHGDLLVGTYFRCVLGRLDIPANIQRRIYTISGASPSYDQYLYSGDEDLLLHWTEEVGNALVESAAWCVGQQTVDELSSEVLHAYHQVYQDGDSLLTDSIGRFEGNIIELQTFSAYDRQLYVPLPFTYARGLQNALPVVAIQHDLISFKLNIRGRNQLIIAKDVSNAPSDIVTLDNATQTTGGQMSSPGMMAEFVFLDKPEQRAYCDQSFEKYFEFTQGPYTTSVAADVTSHTITSLNFNHSVSSLWCCYRATSRLSAGTFDYFNFSTDLSTSYQPDRVTALNAAKTGINRAENPFDVIEFQLNSAPRISRPGVYWHEMTSYQNRVTRKSSSHVMMYSFAANHGQEEGPSGALNIGRFTITPMVFTFHKGNAAATGLKEAGTIYVWAKTQAFYRVVGGRFALLWSTR